MPTMTTTMVVMMTTVEQQSLMMMQQFTDADDLCGFAHMCMMENGNQMMQQFTDAAAADYFDVG